MVMVTGMGTTATRARWSGTRRTTTPAARRVAAHGRVPGGKTKVKLQVKLPGGWHTFASTKSSKKGKFAISGTLDWYGTHKVRVSTAGRHRFNRSNTANVFMTYAPRGNPADHVFLNHQGVRYSFDPCKTVRYVVNADDVGPNGILLAQLAMAQISAATGIPVKFVGTSHQIPFQTEHTRLPGQPGPADRVRRRGRDARLRHQVGARVRWPGPAARRARRSPSPGVGEHPVGRRLRHQQVVRAATSTGPSWAPSRSGARSCCTSSATPSASTTRNGADEIMYWQAGQRRLPRRLLPRAVRRRRPGGAGQGRSRPGLLPAGPPVPGRRAGSHPGSPSRCRSAARPAAQSRVRRSCSSSQSLALPKKPATSWTSLPSASCESLEGLGVAVRGLLGRVRHACAGRPRRGAGRSPVRIWVYSPESTQPAQLGRAQDGERVGLLLDEAAA